MSVHLALWSKCGSIQTLQKMCLYTLVCCSPPDPDRLHVLWGFSKVSKYRQSVLPLSVLESY